MTQFGDNRFFVEYLDCARGLEAIKARGGDPDNDTMWDFCDQHEITVRKEFPSKWRAAEWARRNKNLDVFHMPRLVEETFNPAVYSDTGEPIPGCHGCWEQTGYWETDGRTEIDPTQYPRD